MMSTEYKDNAEALRGLVLDPLGAQLKRLRELRKLTQQEVADLVGVSRNWIARRERGERDVNLKALVLHAHALQCDVNIELIPHEQQL